MNENLSRGRACPIIKRYNIDVVDENVKVYKFTDGYYLISYCDKFYLYHADKLKKITKLNFDVLVKLGIL